MVNIRRRLNTILPQSTTQQQVAKSSHKPHTHPHDKTSDRLHAIQASISNRDVDDLCPRGHPVQLRGTGMTSGCDGRNMRAVTAAYGVQLQQVAVLEDVDGICT